MSIPSNNNINNNNNRLKAKKSLGAAA